MNLRKEKTRISKPFFSFSMYEKTGVYAVDMVAEFIAHERHFRKPVKTIFLRKNLFEQFRDFVIKKMGEKEFWEAYSIRPSITFDDVEIKEGSDMMLRKIWCDYYQDKVN